MLSGQVNVHVAASAKLRFWILGNKHETQRAASPHIDTSDVGWRPSVDYVPHRLVDAIRKRPNSRRNVEADRGPVICQTKRFELRDLRSMGEDLLLTLRTDSRVDTLEPSRLNASNGLIDSVTAHYQKIVWGHR